MPEFGEINPTYPDIFQTFSPPRLFAPIGSNVTDVFFTVPGTTDVPGMSRGFGAVFTDVDLANTTSLQFFDPFGASLGTFFVPTANNGLSFLGLQFEDAFIGRVRSRPATRRSGRTTATVSTWSPWTTSSLASPRPCRNRRPCCSSASAPAPRSARAGVVPCNRPWLRPSDLGSLGIEI